MDVVVVSNHTSRMLKRLHWMRLNGLYCDVGLRIGDQTFPAHRAVLAARADVFENLFDMNILQHDEEEIVMNNVDVQVLQQALRFIYLGQGQITKVPAA